MRGSAGAAWGGGHACDEEAVREKRTLAAILPEQKRRPQAPFS
ncbi:hypothetical protein ACS15_0366 [Ralstonia insidiosa]|uniref:Uncharacterized protein n=1 Tax=Ralstonia insidiosa TaxID=190721 RepID=A0AAC9BCW3_9RALS|nr:hypothetical protein ACS15_0366 [Ralstonia insidiosa]